MAADWQRLANVLALAEPEVPQLRMARRANGIRRPTGLLHDSVIAMPENMPGPPSDVQHHEDSLSLSLSLRLGPTPSAPGGTPSLCISICLSLSVSPIIETVSTSASPEVLPSDSAGFDISRTEFA